MWLMTSLRSINHKAAHDPSWQSYFKKSRNLKVLKHTKKKVGIIFTIKNTIFRKTKRICVLKSINSKLCFSKRYFTVWPLWLYWLVKVKKLKL